MPAFRRRPLAATICCLFAAAQVTAAAADVQRVAAPVASALPEETPDIKALKREAAEPKLKLRMERKLLSVVPKGIHRTKALPQPVFISAENIEGRNEESTVADGNAELRKGDVQLLADHFDYRPLEDEVEAKGNVRLTQFDDEVRGPYMRMKLSQQIGHFDDADYRVKREVSNKFYRPVSAVNVVGGSTTVTNAPMLLNVSSSYGLTEALPTRRSTESTGHAKRIDFEGENQISMREATYSTCKEGAVDWFLKSDYLHFDYDRERANGDATVLYFKDVPVLYSPFVTFSLNHKRTSGFLPPMFSASTRNGLDLTLPYYWSMAPNYDLTLYPREMAKRGTQLGSEFRYLDYHYNGSAKFEYLPEDQLAKRTRWAFNLSHSHDFGRGVSASLDYNRVSDDMYWSDLSSRLLQTTQTQLPQQLRLSYAQPNSWWSANMNWLRYQTLQPDPKNPVTRPYFVEPQINFSGRLPDISGTDFSLIGQYSYFTHPTQVDGQRMVLYPQISLPFVSPSFSITPKFGVHATRYDLQQQASGQPGKLSRTVPTFTLDSTVAFERETNWLGRNFIQTLEPRLYYVNIPYRDQDRIPVFDTGAADFNFAQIFTENRYTGYDRISDANQLTAAVTNRLLDGNTGAEYFRAMIGQRYYFQDQRVTIPGEVPPPHSFSNSLFAFNGLVASKTYLDSALEYNHHEQRTQRFSVGARYQPDSAKVASASYRQSRDGLGKKDVDQVDFAAQWPLGGRWHAVGRYNYSLKDKQLLEAIAGAEYNAGCWAARFVVQRLEAVGGAPNTTFFFQLELNDFASIGSNPIQLLRRSVPGYGKVNEWPTTGSLLTQ